MGWFDEQIKQRKMSDDELFSESFAMLAESVLGRSSASALKNDLELTKDAINEILRYYHVKMAELPEGLRDFNEQLEYYMRPYGIMKRVVHLEGEWYQDAIGAMLGVRRDNGMVAALIPDPLFGYSFFDTETGKRVKINKKNKAVFEREAYAFYEPFPMRKLKLRDILKVIAEGYSTSDKVMIGAGFALATMAGMLVPFLQQILFSTVLTSGSMGMLIGMAVFMICVSVSVSILETLKNMIIERVASKTAMRVEAATMMRILSLKPDFFGRYGSGELMSYVENVNSLANIIGTGIVSGGLAAVFSLAYLTQVSFYAKDLMLPSICVILANLILSLLITVINNRISRERMEYAAKNRGMTFAMISGIQKIKLAGAEKRAFAKWAGSYAKVSALEYNPPMIIKFQAVFASAIAALGMIVMYAYAVRGGVSVSEYYAFLTASGFVTTAFTGLSAVALQAAGIKPILEISKPIFDAEPEVSAGRKMVTSITGAIELSNVSFRYREDMPNVLDNLSLRIRPGQYVAIVGKTGCGKSTLMKLLLGFLKPQKGAVYYDGKDINNVDLPSLRRKLGVVLQDGKLFQGDIFSNIVVSAPWLGMDEAWEAAELAGIAEDIREMPMGMHTFVSEGQGGISGGQRQRIMIARAIAPKPKVLMMDEATSALDNITQKQVSESLDSLKCTRIVIAHRLSTIRHCDRIIVLDKGRIIEDGTYDELIAEKGFFSELIERQRLDVQA